MKFLLYSFCAVLTLTLFAMCNNEGEGSSTNSDTTTGSGSSINTPGNGSGTGTYDTSATKPADSSAMPGDSRDAAKNDSIKPR